MKKLKDFIKINFLRIVDFYLRKKRRIVFKSRTGNKGDVLFSYVLIPSEKLKWKFYYEWHHNNRLMCYNMIKSLLEAGYNVYLYDYLDENVDTSMQYSIFFGHNRTFKKIGEKINAEKKILITTGSSPEFDNLALEKRNKDLQERKKTNEEFYIPIKNYEYAKENFKHADFVFMIGNDFIEKTWYPEYKDKYYHYHNIITFKGKKKSGRCNNFFFMSTIGQLRRGFDLIIDIFIDRKEHVYIRTQYEKEEKFVELYKEDLNKKNITVLGHFDPNSKSFKNIINNADFVILPSCSEGESGSVLNLMALGLIPVIPENVGIDNIDELGYKIETIDINGVKKAIEIAVNASHEEINIKRERIYEEMKKYTEQEFCSNFKKFIEWSNKKK